MPAAQAANSTEAHPTQDRDQLTRLHITPLRPELLKVYLAPSVLPSARHISYHTVETFPEKGFGYVELPELEAQKLKKKLNGTTLRGSKVRIEMAKSEKRKAREEADAAKEMEEVERPSKRAKKEKRKKENGVLDGVELPDGRKVKRGWTEPLSKNKKDRKEKKGKEDKKDKDERREQKHSKYTKEPELLFKAKLTPVAATEIARKEKSKNKKEKKEKNKSKSREVVVHEFEKNTKTPSFLKETKVTTEKKPAVDYVNGVGWVDEDGTVVEPETGRAKHSRALELVDKPTEAQKAWIDGSALESTSTTQATKKKKQKKFTPPPASSSEEDDDESSVVSSSDPDSEADSDTKSAISSPAQAVNDRETPDVLQASASEEKEVHPLEALFKRAKPAPGSSLPPAKKLTPINTSFSFFDSTDDAMEAEDQATENVPATPFTQRDLEWRGLRSAAPTPDTATIGRRFSFDWRKGSQEAVDDDDDEAMDDTEAEQQLSLNTMANATAKHLPSVAEEDENEEAEAGANQSNTDQEKPESEFRKWFWENRGDLNRAWKKRRRDALKSKRHSENRKMTGGRRSG